jgi:hypothetical protein
MVEPLEIRTFVVALGIDRRRIPGEVDTIRTTVRLHLHGDAPVVVMCSHLSG